MPNFSVKMKVWLFTGYATLQKYAKSVSTYSHLLSSTGWTNTGSPFPVTIKNLVPPDAIKYQVDEQAHWMASSFFQFKVQ
jgi:hypothetical protein